MSDCCCCRSRFRGFVATETGASSSSSGAPRGQNYWNILVVGVLVGVLEIVLLLPTPRTCMRPGKVLNVNEESNL